MKPSHHLKIFFLVLFLSGISTFLQAQSRYKHLPRVKVDKGYNKAHRQNKEEKFTTILPEIIYEPVASINSTEENISEQIVVASAENNRLELKYSAKESKVTVKEKSIKKLKKGFNIDYFTEQLKTKVELYKVKHIGKTNANTPLILMIVFYIVGVILVVLALLMLYGLFPGVSLTTFFIILILGILFSVAASVLLTLIKLGVL